MFMTASPAPGILLCFVNMFSSQLMQFAQSQSPECGIPLSVRWLTDQIIILHMWRIAEQFPQTAQRDWIAERNLG